MDTHTFYFSLAKTIAKRSLDPKAKYGAVLVHPKMPNVITCGHNSFPTGIEEHFSAKIYRRKFMIHSEINAMLSATCMLTNFEIYSTHLPSLESARLIIQSGIKKVHCFDPAWGTSGKFLLSDITTLFEAGEVELCLYK